MTQDSLDRFVQAQARVFADVASELAVGRKQTHWMWFIFPQLAALGRSATAQFYGLADLAEARAYLAHPLLGARLRHCVGLIMPHVEKTAHEIFGSPDDMKLRSCLTLFREAAQAQADRTLFQAALGQFYGAAASGVDADGADPLTLEILHGQGS